MSEGGSRVPKIVWITTPLFAAAFAGFLFYLSQVPAGNEAQAVKGDAKKVMQEGIDRVKKEAVESVAQEHYDFYRLLEDSEVPVPEPEESPYQSTPKDQAREYQYLLQAASFQSAEQADSLRVQLIIENLDSSIEKVNVKGTDYYRVMVGPFENRSTMNKAQDALVERNIKALVVRKPLVAAE